MSSIKKKKKTKKQLKRELLEARASTLLAYKFAYDMIHKTSTDHLMGSGVLLQLTGIGGNQLTNPVLIRDGLSKETIEAIKKDIKRSSELEESIKIKNNETL